MGTIDRTRPYGTVCGVSDHTYEQDGKRFDGMGNEVGSLEPEVSKPDNVEISVGEPTFDESPDVQAEEETSGMTKDDKTFIAIPRGVETDRVVADIANHSIHKLEKKRGRPPKK